MLGGGEKRLNRLYIVNQCSSELDCDLKVDPFRDWRSYNDMMSDLIPTVNIYVNGEKKIDFQDGTPATTIPIKKNDLIFVSSSPGNYQFGMNFTTTAQNSLQGDPIKWFSSNVATLATQSLIPSTYFTLPLSGVTLYESTNAPIQLNSTIITGNSIVTLVCDSQIISSYDLQMNSLQSFLIPIETAGKSCEFINSLSLNKVTFNVKQLVPASIAFVSPPPGSSFIAGTNVTIKLITVADQSKVFIKNINGPENQDNFMVTLTCGSLNPVTQVITTNIDGQNFIIPDDYYGGGCVFAITYPIMALNSPSINVLSFLTVTAPSSITYGQSLSLKVETSGPQVEYTVSFACPTGSYQVTGLTTGDTYNIVPAGIYGQAVITVTATSNSPVTFSLNILKAAGNIPPAFIPGHLPNFPSVYDNVTDGNHLGKPEK